MGVTTTKTNKPLNPRGNDQSPLAYNRAKLYSGKALDFDGVNDEITGSSALNFTTQTITGYFYLDTTSGSQFIIDTRDNPNDGMVLWFNSANSKMQYLINDGTNAVETEAVETGKWYFIAATYDGTTQSIYLNGQLSASRATSQTINVTTAYRVGARSFTTPLSFWNGKLANIKAFNVALTAAQVADLYNNPEKVVPTGVSNTALKLWLPMMEGAGTTAYDGSGNGNHGTINGATYVNGVGAPVAQTAVIDWNKGSNLFPYSNDYSQSNWSKADLTIVANSAISPDGSNNASLLYVSSNSSASYLYDVLNESSAVYTISAFVKASGRSICWMYMQGSASNGVAYFDLSDQSTQVVAGSDSTLTATITSVGNDWYKISATSSASFPISSGSGIGICDAKGSLNATADGTNGILVYGLHLHSGSVGPYIPTLSTAQTTPVLLPQGLTSGRDITGVNLFENVRKQGALNLDGNSWAEVHDNASLDITDAVSLEMWIYWEDQSAEKTILGKWVSGDNRAYALIATTTTGEIDFRQRVSSSTYQLGISTLSSGWNHVVATHDHSANERIGYINGVQVSLSSSQGVNNESDNNITIGGHSVAQYTQPIAQPRIYNRALTAEEVERNYTAGKYKYIYTND
jgi:hypothetical protein